MLVSNSSTITSYEYYLPGTPIPLFKHRKTEIDSNPAISEGEYMMKGFPVGLQDLVTDEGPWTVLTNPITDGQLVLGHGTRDEGPVLLQLYDINGRRVMEQTLTPQTGSPSLEVDLHDVPSGLYTLSIQDGSSLQTLMLVME
jgi:hypothetical protein